MQGVDKRLPLRCEPRSGTSRFFRFQQLSSDDAGLNRLVARSEYVDGGPDRIVDAKWRQCGSGHERETQTHGRPKVQLQDC